MVYNSREDPCRPWSVLKLFWRAWSSSRMAFQIILRPLREWNRSFILCRLKELALPRLSRSQLGFTRPSHSVA